MLTQTEDDSLEQVPQRHWVILGKAGLRAKVYTFLMGFIRKKGKELEKKTCSLKGNDFIAVKNLFHFSLKEANPALKFMSLQSSRRPILLACSVRMLQPLIVCGLHSRDCLKKYDLVKACTQNTSLASDLWTFKYFKLTSGRCHEDRPWSLADSRTSVEAFTKLID